MCAAHQCYYSLLPDTSPSEQSVARLELDQNPVVIRVFYNHNFITKQTPVPYTTSFIIYSFNSIGLLWLDFLAIAKKFEKKALTPSVKD